MSPLQRPRLRGPFFSSSLPNPISSFLIRTHQRTWLVILKMQQISVTHRTFQYFLKLPQELRDRIWRECLPCRVVELDFPDRRDALCIPLDDDSDCDNQAQPPPACSMSNTSNLDAAPQIISRVCRESRWVAFETGGFMDNPLHRRVHCQSARSRIKKQWFDNVRDAIHLHWNAYIDSEWGIAPDPDVLVPI